MCRKSEVRIGKIYFYLILKANSVVTENSKQVVFTALSLFLMTLSGHSTLDTA